MPQASPAESSEPEPATSPSVVQPDGPARPEGLAHGRWEAPKWAFYAAFGAALSLGIMYFLFRILFKRRALGRDARDARDVSRDAKPAAKR